MTPSLLLTALAALMLFLLLHVVLWRMVRRKGLLLLVALAAATYCTVIICLTVLDIPGEIWSALPMFCLAVLAYLHWYVGTYRSVSVRILEEALRSGDRISLTTLETVYSKQWMLQSRLDVLLQHRWTDRDNALRYSLTRKGALFAALISTVRSLYGIHQAG